jgi:hypothetical protein
MSHNVEPGADKAYGIEWCESCPFFRATPLTLADVRRNIAPMGTSSQLIGQTQHRRAAPLWG